MAPPTSFSRALKDFNREMFDLGKPGQKTQRKQGRNKTGNLDKAQLELTNVWHSSARIDLKPGLCWHFGSQRKILVLVDHFRILPACGWHVPSSKLSLVAYVAFPNFIQCNNLLCAQLRCEGNFGCPKSQKKFKLAQLCYKLSFSVCPTPDFQFQKILEIHGDLPDECK